LIHYEDFRTNQITGNIGLYYVCYLLSELGWNVMPTSRNTRGVDIVIFDEREKHTIQVKTLRERNNVSFGKTPDLFQDANYLVIVRLDQNRIYITQDMKQVQNHLKTYKGKSFLGWKTYEKYDTDLEKVVGH
jgi:hypothetical protein